MIICTQYDTNSRTYGGYDLRVPLIIPPPQKKGKRKEKGNSTVTIYIWKQAFQLSDSCAKVLNFPPKDVMQMNRIEVHK